MLSDVSGREHREERRNMCGIILCFIFCFLIFFVGEVFQLVIMSQMYKYNNETDLCILSITFICLSIVLRLFRTYKEQVRLQQLSIDYKLFHCSCQTGHLILYSICYFKGSIYHSFLVATITILLPTVYLLIDLKDIRREHMQTASTVFPSEEPKVYPYMYTSVQIEDHQCSSEECNECPCYICSEKIDRHAVLGCGHKHHHSCLIKWWSTSNHKQIQCPLCRFSPPPSSVSIQL